MCFYTFEHFDLTNIGGESVVVLAAFWLWYFCVFWYFSCILGFLYFLIILVANQRLCGKLSAFGAAAAGGLAAASPTRQRESHQGAIFIKIITKV